MLHWKFLWWITFDIPPINQTDNNTKAYRFEASVIIEFKKLHRKWKIFRLRQYTYFEYVLFFPLSSMNWKTRKKKSEMKRDIFNKTEGACTWLVSIRDINVMMSTRMLSWDETRNCYWNWNKYYRGYTYKSIKNYFQRTRFN